MPNQESLRLLGEIDTETTRVAAVVTQCQTDIHEGMTAAEVADVNGRLTTVGNSLKAIAHDPNDPIPDPIAVP